MKQRCLPATFLKMQRLFTDDKCTLRTALSPVDDCTPKELPTYATTTEPDDCARRSEVWKVGESVPKAELPPLWTNITGVCNPATFKEGSFLKLTLADPSQFMAGEPQIE